MKGKVLVRAVSLLAGFCAGSAAAAPVFLARELVTQGTTGNDESSWVLPGSAPDEVIWSLSVRGPLTVPANDGEESWRFGFDGVLPDTVALHRSTADPGADWVFRASGPMTQIGLEAIPDPSGGWFIGGFIEGETTFFPIATGLPSIYQTTPYILDPLLPTKDPFVGHLNTNGILEWIDVGPGDYSNFLSGLSPAQEGGFYAAGTTRRIQEWNVGKPTALRLPRITDPVDSFDVYLTRWSPQGTVLWGRLVGGGGDDTCGDLATLPGGDVVLVGRGAVELVLNQDEADEQTLPLGSDEQCWIARWDSLGNVVWARTFGGPGLDRANGVEVLPDGDLIVCGSVSNGAIFEMVGGEVVEALAEGDYWSSFVSRVRASDGAFLWTKLITSPSSLTTSWDASATSDGRWVLVAGEYSGTLLESENGRAWLEAAGGLDGMLQIFDAHSGERQAVWGVRGSGTDRVFDVEVLGDVVHLVGTYSDGADFSAGSVRENPFTRGGTDAFLWSLDYSAPKPLLGWMAF